MIRYTFREDVPLFIKNAKLADAQKLGEALETVSAKAGGDLTANDVVNAARNKKSALHQHFEWDDAVAAESFRLDQARAIIAIVKAPDPEVEGGVTRAFESISLNGVRAYRHITAIRKSADFQMALLAQAERDLDAFERRYRSLSVVCKHIAAARDALAAAKTEVNESRAAA